MKFPRNAIVSVLVVVASAGLSQAKDEELELKEYEKEGGKNSGLTKLMMMKDFDPDDEDDEELVKDVLDTAIVALEVDEARSRLSSFRSALSILKLLRSRIRNIKSLDYEKYPNHDEFPDVDLSGMMKMMGGFPPLNQVFSPRKIVRLILRLTTTSLALDTVLDDVNNAKSQEEAYKACFTKPTIGRFGILPNLRNFLPAPYAVDNWEKDSEFARQYFCGTNPVMIEVAKDPEKQLSKNIVNHFGKDKLQELADKNQLLFVSYDDLADLKVNPHQMFPLPMNDASGPDGGPAPQVHPKFFYAPIVAFTYDYDKDELDVLGIQLERTDDARVYTKNTCGENEWLAVKCQVIAADSNMHEWVSHLGNTHLTMEPHIIAIYNTLRQARHPLYTFLRQTTRDTLLLNWGARRSLASFEPKAFGDYQSSAGVGQFMQLIEKMWSRYSFFEKAGLPNELASRGFTEDVQIPAYLYREDGMKLWNAIGGFATDFVDEVFDSDEAVASDEVVQEWAKETTDPDKGDVKGFPTSFEDKETVAKVLQTIMWMASGLHAAVNFPQYEEYGYVPHKPLHLRADFSTMPEDDAEIREWMFENMFPHINTDDDWLRESANTLVTDEHAAIDSLAMVSLLTTPSRNCLDNLSDRFEKIGTEAYDKFLKNLNVISEEIEARNEEAEKANKAPYNYLNPSNVPSSIDI
ncbi:lipoxygenase [Skeletonema marinoi]|uniref:Lipoxygenase n=1 Tax=Skeletonema marinoi TaxID=267567 RepID=A0AAD8XVR1_9STRA|nr:lipoxygenase [Skeletonema marinoi]